MRIYSDLICNEYTNITVQSVQDRTRHKPREKLTVDYLGGHLILGDDQVIGDGGQVAAHFLITDHGASEKQQLC